MDFDEFMRGSLVLGQPYISTDKHQECQCKHSETTTFDPAPPTPKFPPNPHFRPSQARSHPTQPPHRTVDTHFKANSPPPPDTGHTLSSPPAVGHTLCQPSAIGHTLCRLSRSDTAWQESNRAILRMNASRSTHLTTFVVFCRQITRPRIEYTMPAPAH